MRTLIASLLTGVLATCSFAQSVDQRLYDGALSLKAQKISIKGWGSGTIAETKEMAFQGAQSVRVSSRNYFQGGTINFNSPSDFAEKFDDRSNVLRVTFLLADASTLYGNTAKNRGPGEANTGLTTFHNAASMNSSKKGDLAITKSIPFKPTIKKIRMVILTTDGKRSETYVPVYTSTSAGNGWRKIVIPLQSINGLERTNKIIKSMTLSTDTVATVYVGDVSVISETTPIGGVIDNAPLNVKWGSEVTLTAYGEGGDTPLIYSWDFDVRDGIQADAEGQQVKYRFRKSGEYLVTVTISDYYGLKTPAQQTLKVKVAG